MRGFGGIGQRGADTGQRGNKADQLQIADELVDLFLTALEVHAEHTAVAVALELLVGQRLAGRGLQTGNKPFPPWDGSQRTWPAPCRFPPSS